MVQLKDLVESLFSNLLDTSIVLPSFECAGQLGSSLNPLHAIQQDKRCAEELVLGSPINIDVIEILLDFVLLLYQLL